jgi:endo-1,4-beta-xylanase
MAHGGRPHSRFTAGAFAAAAGALVIGATITAAGCLTTQALTGSLAFVGNVWPSGITDDEHFLRYWNQVTVENAGKWGNVEAVRDQMQWRDLDSAYRFAREHHIPFRLHTLVWGQAQPPWLGPLSPEELRQEVTEWFTLLGERYPDVDMIDVVNEPLHAQPPYMAALGGVGETRWDWVIAAFELARRHFPRAMLGINEYGTLEHADATAGYLRLIGVLKQRGLIDSIGVQGHGLEDVSDETIAANLDLLAKSGLPIYVTELDVGIADDEAQAKRMQVLLTLFTRNRHVRGVTLWGYQEGRIYQRRAFLLGADGRERPALVWLREFTAQLPFSTGEADCEGL